MGANEEVTPVVPKPKDAPPNPEVLEVPKVFDPKVEAVAPIPDVPNPVDGVEPKGFDAAAVVPNPNAGTDPNCSN